MIRRKWIPKYSKRHVILPREDAAERLPLQHNEPPEAQTLRFSPTAWAKLLYLRDLGDSEVGGFGISAAEDLLCIENVELVEQTCTGASVVFEDQSVAEFFDRQVDQGRSPAQFGRAWIHTHPGNGPQPSMVDEETFARVFGRTDWALLFILARGGRSYARLQFHVGPGGSLLLPVAVDFGHPFAASNQAAWREEYLANVQVEEWLPLERRLEPIGADPWPPVFKDDSFDPWTDFPEEKAISLAFQDPARMPHDDLFPF